MLFGTVANISIADLAFVVKELGAENAINLDGGDSSAFYLDGVYDTKPSRGLSNAVYLPWRTFRQTPGRIPKFSQRKKMV
ncbi:MAG TPA: phosphodiester glycosidase family protein [Bacillota bacterium]|nr:phosphodiester glycosidase family protein [Bacillota bacterium]